MKVSHEFRNRKKTVQLITVSGLCEHRNVMGNRNDFENKRRAASKTLI